MQCEQLNERLADYWMAMLPGASAAGAALSEQERAKVEAHLATCPACRREAAELSETWRAMGAVADEEPSPSLERRVTAMIDAWREAERGTAAASTPVPTPAASRREPGAWSRWWSARPWQPAWQLAAAVLLVTVGFGAGRGWPSGAARQEIGELRGELRGMREIVALALLQQDSAVERLRGVNWSHQLDRPSGAVLDTLLDTLAHDPNVNVRLAAIDALREFSGEETVRTGLVDALQKQPQPLVQIALIDTMVDLRERRSVQTLRTIAEDQKTNEAVRQRARRGLQQLSS